jgi:hypothetical protein
VVFKIFVVFQDFLLQYGGYLLAASLQFGNRGEECLGGFGVTQH